MINYTIDKSDFSKYIKDIITDKGRHQDTSFEYERVNKVIFSQQQDGYYNLEIHYYDYWDGDAFFTLNVENLNRAQYNSICNFIIYIICNKQRELMKSYNQLLAEGKTIEDHLKKINTLFVQDRRQE